LLFLFLCAYQTVSSYALLHFLFSDAQNFFFSYSSRKTIETKAKVSFLILVTFCYISSLRHRLHLYPLTDVKPTAAA